MTRSKRNGIAASTSSKSGNSGATTSSRCRTSPWWRATMRKSRLRVAGRPQLARALDELRPGDCLVLAEWDRATRSMWDGLHIVKQVLDAGATIKVLDFPSLDLTTREGRGFLALFSAMAERERMRIVKR